MLDIIKKNQFYFLSYFIFFIALFILIVQTEPLDAILFFGNHRTTGGDSFFKWVTLLGEAYPFIILTIYFLWRKQAVTARKIAIAGIIVLAVCLLLKALFSFDRPATYLDKMRFSREFQYVKDVFILRGPSSFPSGHTAGAFAAWSLLAFQVRKKNAQFLCLLLAILVGISRVYLTQHFPQDVLFGSVVGIAVAIGIEHIIESWELKKALADKPMSIV